MRHLLCFFLHFFFWAMLPAQPTIEWSRTMGGMEEEGARSVKRVPTGGYIVAGFAESTEGDVLGNHGSYDFWVIKLTETGDTEWKKCLGGSQFDLGHSVDLTSDGGYVVAGLVNSNNGNVSGNHGSEDIWLVKLNSQGAIQWEKTYGGSERDHLGDLTGGMESTQDNGFILTGFSESTNGDVTANHGYSDIWVVKTDGSGSIQWQKSYGGSNYETPTGIHQTTDGGYIILGNTRSNDGDVSGHHGNDDIWVLKIGALGNIEWQKTYGGSNLDRGNSIRQTNDGAYIIIGSTMSNDGDVSGNHPDSDVWLIKIDSTGNIQWQKYLIGYGTDIFQTMDGGYVLGGSKGYPESFWIEKINAEGDFEWQASYGGSDNDRIYAMGPSNNGGFILAGTTWSNDGDVSGFHGLIDMWIVKLNPEFVGSSEPSSPNGRLDIFPNPAQQSIQIKIGALPTETVTELGAETSLTIRIADLLGRLLYHQTVQNSNNLDVSALPKGLYVITATTPKGKVYVQKFRKE